LDELVMQCGQHLQDDEGREHDLRQAGAKGWITSVNMKLCPAGA
jgi:hypothetical protein